MTANPQTPPRNDSAPIAPSQPPLRATAWLDRQPYRP